MQFGSVDHTLSGDNLYLADICGVRNCAVLVCAGCLWHARILGKSPVACKCHHVRKREIRAPGGNRPIELVLTSLVGEAQIILIGFPRLNASMAWFPWFRGFHNLGLDRSARMFVHQACQRASAKSSVWSGDSNL
jgi:hypothetical protein